MLKYKLKRCVLRWRLKAAVFLMCLMSDGREFHVVWPATATAHSPILVMVGAGLAESNGNLLLGLRQ